MKTGTPKSLLVLVLSLFFLSTSFLKPQSVEARIPMSEIVSLLGLDNEAEIAKKKSHLKNISEDAKGNTNRTGYFSAAVEGGFITTTFYAGGSPSEETLQVMGFDGAEIAQIQKKYGRGAIGEVGTWTAALYTPPASSTTYLADLFQSARIVPEARAQGLGFASLDPILSTWKTFRNISYLFFVFVFIVVGFMIMFQHKINGQTVVTAQQAIPHIIVSMIFVTFSYAIAGLLIDLMYVFMYFIISLFNGSGRLVNLSVFGMASELIKTGWESTFESVNEMMEELIGKNIWQDALGLASGVLVSLIVALGILFSIFKLFIQLLKNYISIILHVAFAPLLLMIGAVPGQNVFGGWLKQIVANLLAFPIVLLTLLMSELMTSYEIQSGGFMPPFLLGQGIGGAMPTVVGIGILLILPEIIEQVKKAMGVSEGIFGELAGVARQRLGKGAAVGAPVGLGAYGALGGGVGGGLWGAAQGIREGKSLAGVGQQAWGGLKRGAAYGGVGGAVAPNIPRLVGEIGRTGWRQGMDYASAETLGTGVRKLREMTDNEFLQEALSRLEDQTQARGTPQTSPRVRQSGVEEEDDTYGH